MKAIRDLSHSERDALKTKHLNARHFKTHFSDVIDETHCYEMAIYPTDYRRIWIHACIPNLSTYPNQKLSEVIDYLKSQEDFTKISIPMFLNLQQLKNYIDVLSQCKDKSEHCFDEISGFNCFLLDRDGIEVTDGMHRLVAYGLVTNMKEENFPISVYLGTSKSIEEIDVI